MRNDGVFEFVAGAVMTFMVMLLACFIASDVSFENGVKATVAERWTAVKITEPDGRFVWKVVRTNTRP